MLLSPHPPFLQPQSSSERADLHPGLRPSIIRVNPPSIRLRIVRTVGETTSCHARRRRRPILDFGPAGGGSDPPSPLLLLLWAFFSPIQSDVIPLLLFLLPARTFSSAVHRKYGLAALQLMLSRRIRFMHHLKYFWKIPSTSLLPFEEIYSPFPFLFPSLLPARPCGQENEHWFSSVYLLYVRHRRGVGCATNTTAKPTSQKKSLTLVFWKGRRGRKKNSSHPTTKSLWDRR